MKRSRRHPRTQLVQFDSLLDYPPPFPATRAVPDWFKKIPTLDNGESTLKNCMPFVDAMTAGYLIPLWVDLSVDYDGDTPVFHWRPDGPDQVSLKPKPERHFDGRLVFQLQNPWSIRTPPGYSCLFVPPLNNPADRLTCYAAIVDTDTYVNYINFPFYWASEDRWEGVIKQGTPIIQVIPFRRDVFSLSVNEHPDNIVRGEQDRSSKIFSVFTGGYRASFWARKHYN